MSAYQGEQRMIVKHRRFTPCENCELPVVFVEPYGWMEHVEGARMASGKRGILLHDARSCSEAARLPDRSLKNPDNYWRLRFAFDRYLAAFDV